MRLMSGYIFMQYINNLKKSDFIVILKSPIYNPKSQQDRKRLDIAYERFLIRISKLAGGKRSPVEKLRILTHLHELIDLARINMADRASVRYHYAHSACSILNFEKRTILLQLKYPGMSEGTAVRKAPFRLSKKYTPTDLMEIITSLHAIGFFCLSDGSPASLTDMTKEFETLCGIKFRNPETCRWAVLNRKTKLTNIIDTLRRTLLELSIK